MKFLQSDIDFLKSMVDTMPTDPPPYLISEYTKDHRVMPASTPFPGAWENERTFYANEIMDCLSPYNPIQYIDVMSAAQVVKTSLMENVIGFYMGADPAPILFISGSNDMLKSWADKKLEPMIDSYGLRNKLVAPVENEKSRRTGDTTFQKLFSGGFLIMGSAQAASSLRAHSVRILLMDEVDSAPAELITKEGHWDLVAEARTSAFGNRKKILACSTPTEYRSSTIYRRFLLGDQCEFHIPCPRCNKYQLLERGEPTGSHGLRFEMKNGLLDSVYYQCEFCHEPIHEHEKNKFIPKGKWIPMAKPERLRRSFHLNGLLSPLGMFSWMDYYSEYITAQKGQGHNDMREFINLRDGQVFIDKGTRPKPERLLENRGKYRIGEVPEGVLYLVGGADIQAGSKNDPENPARIEFHVVGIGAGYKKWSIDYQIFDGSIDDPYSGAWEMLNDYAIKTGLQYTRKIDGMKFPVNLVLIDSGDGNSTGIVYQFCQRWQNTFPCKGQRSIARKKQDKGDELTDASFRRYRYSKVGEDITLIEVATVYYKNQIYSSLKIDRLPQDPQKNGFFDFPVDYNEKFFDQLAAEERMASGEYISHGRRNEVLDTAVYASCAADAYLEQCTLDLRTNAKLNDANQIQIQAIDHKVVLQQMEENTKIIKKT